MDHELLSTTVLGAGDRILWVCQCEEAGVIVAEFGTDPHVLAERAHAEHASNPDEDE